MPITVTIQSPAPTFATNQSVTISGQTAGIASLQGQIDTGQAFPVPLNSSGAFSITIGLTSLNLTNGTHVVQLTATDLGGKPAGPYDASFIFNTQPPTITVLSPAANSYTNSVTVTGVVTDLAGVASLQGEVDGGSFTAIPFNGQGDFSFNTGLAVGGAADGPHTVYLQATDNAGNTSSVLAVPFILKTRPPTVPTFDLAAGTADLGPETTSAAVVTLIGHSDPGVTLSLVGTTLTAMASNTGGFQIPNVSLAVGANTLTVEATDQAGNTSSYSLTVTRGTAISSQPNPVIVWNQATLNAIQTDGTNPLMASRALAMVQAAVYDAVNNVEGTPAYYIKITSPADSSVDAAVDAAAHDVLGYLYPAQQETFDSLLASELALLPTGQGTTDGETVGQAVGNAIIAMRGQRWLQGLRRFHPGHGSRRLAADGAVATLLRSTRRAPT